MFWNFKTLACMNYVVWWQPYDGQLSICVWWMFVGQSYGHLFILLASTCLYLWWWMRFVWPCVVSHFYFEIVAIVFFLFVEWNNMSYCILFTLIYLITHTCCTPRIAKFRGSFCLDVCKSCIDDSKWNSNSCIHQGGALHKFWGSKALILSFL